METTITSLEEELAAARRDREEAISRSEDLALEVEVLTEKLDISSSEINALQEELSGLVSFVCFPQYIPLVSQFFLSLCKVKCGMLIFV